MVCALTELAKEQAMNLFDTIKKDWQKMKRKSFKEKAGYFFDYYKWPVIVVLVIAIWLGAMLWQKATAPDICLTGVLFNTSNLLAQEKIQDIIDGFSREQELDPDKQTILLHTDLTYFEEEDYIQSNYESLQLLSAWVLSGDVDFIIADASMMEKLAANGYLLEFDDPAQEWNMVSSYLLDVSSSQILRSIYGDLCDTLTLGIAVSTQNTERILAMIDYLGI